MSDLSAIACACGSCASCAGTVPAPAVADPVRFRHSAIRQRMLDGIASVRVEASEPLARLTVRTDDDPAIALIDAYASSLHVLAWNTSRLADDGSILKTEDRDALVDLTRLLGYEPRPAISASTMLAFTVNELAGGPTIAKVAKGTKVASVPKQDEKPQIFETDVEIEARAEWNALLPVLDNAAAPIDAGITHIAVAGVTALVKVGDGIAIHHKVHGQPFISVYFAKVTAVERLAEHAPERTLIHFSALQSLTAIGAPPNQPIMPQITILGQQATVFGANAPDYRLMSVDIKRVVTPSNLNATEWPNFVMDANGAQSGGTVDLDNIYPDAVAGRRVYFSSLDGSPSSQLGSISTYMEGSRKDFGISSKVSRVTLAGIDLRAQSFSGKVRSTLILLQTARPSLLTLPVDESMPKVTDRITVQGRVQLPVGKRITLTGEKWMGSSGLAGPAIAEIATILSATVSGNSTLLIFEAPVTNRFRSTTLRVLGNCASASHGETQNAGAQLGGGEGELLGSGQAAKRNQKFALKAKPLAYVPASNPRGFAAAIEVRVDGRAYKNVDTLYAIDPAERSSTAKTIRDDVSEVQLAGRLPSGINNVTALYRTGGGLSGNMEAGRITMAMAPVLGVTGISNPVAAEGASDAETLEDMRSAAPQSIRTLDRVVSLSDFEAFARGYRGIGKALATELRAGMRSIVCLTIANTDMQSPAAGASLLEDLRQALKTYAVPGRHVRIEGFDRLDPEITAALAIDETLYKRKVVEATARAALVAAFSPAKRGFSTALHRSEVISVLQNVPGVTAVAITHYALHAGPPPDADRLLCPAPKMDGGVFTRGGLLAVNPDYLGFSEMLR